MGLVLASGYKQVKLSLLQYHRIESSIMSSQIECIRSRKSLMARSRWKLGVFDHTKDGTLATRSVIHPRVSGISHPLTSGADVSASTRSTPPFVFVTLLLLQQLCSGLYHSLGLAGELVNLSVLIIHRHLTLQNIVSNVSRSERLSAAWGAANEVLHKIDPSIGIPGGTLQHTLYFHEHYLNNYMSRVDNIFYETGANMATAFALQDYRSGSSSWRGQVLGNTLFLYEADRSTSTMYNEVSTLALVGGEHSS